MGKPIEVLEVYWSKRKHEISATSFYNWKAKYGALLHRDSERARLPRTAQGLFRRITAT